MCNADDAKVCPALSRLAESLLEKRDQNFSRPLQHGSPSLRVCVQEFLRTDLAMPATYEDSPRFDAERGGRSQGFGPRDVSRDPPRNGGRFLLAPIARGLILPVAA